MHKLLRSTLAAAVLAFAGSAAAGPFFFAGPGASNVDTNPGTQVVLTAGGGGMILDLDVSVHIVGGHMEDFHLFLTSPMGTTVKFLHRMVDSFGHVDSPLIATWDDEGTSTVAQLAANPSAGLLVIPFSALSAFDGESLAGNWTLTILDDFVPNEGNALISWSISGQAPVPATLWLLGLGFAGLWFSRRKGR